MMRIRSLRKWSGWEKLKIPLLFLVFLILLTWVQFSTPNLPDNDGYYHIRFAALMREQGWKPDFPWLPLTVLNPREFYDHHFLFHVGLIPFTFGDLRLGAKWASVVFAGLAFLSVYVLLDGQRVPYAWLWSLGSLAISEAFIYRMSITRAQSLSLLVLVVGLHLMLTGRYVWLLALGFLYVWMYNAFPLLPIIAGLYGAGFWLAEGRFEWRPLVWSSIGVGLGLLVNPYFPYNLIFVVRHLLPKLGDATALSVGNEWFPYNTQQILNNSGMALILLFSGVLALGLRGERMEARTATALLLVFLFGWMMLQARRFVEYFPPFTLIFAAFAWKPLIENWQRRASREAVAGSGRLLSRLAPAVLLSSFMVIGLALMLPAARDSINDSKPYDLFAGASDWLKNNTNPGDRVFQTDWDDFPRLFFYNTANTYLIGLDPTYMQLYDEAAYNLWEEATKGGVENLAQVIPANFGAHYIVSDLNHKDFIRQASEEPGIAEVYRDDLSIVYQVK